MPCREPSRTAFFSAPLEHFSSSLLATSSPSTLAGNTRYNKKSLVFDLIEPFRIYGEQTVVYLFTSKQINDEYFDMQEESVSLNQKGKPVVVEAMNKHLDESVRYRRKNVKRRHIIKHECHRLVNMLLAETGEKRPEWLEIKEI